MYDLLMSSDWDLQPNYAGGLLTAEGYQIDYQDVNYRILTNNPDHYLWPVGANLEDLIGLPNTSDTGQKGITSITTALTFDQRFATTALSMNAVPIGQNQIQFFVGLMSTSSILTTYPYVSTVVSL